MKEVDASRSHEYDAFMARGIAMVLNGAGLLYLVYLMLANGFPTAGQPLFIVLLTGSGQLSALIFAVSTMPRRQR